MRSRTNTKPGGTTFPTVPPPAQCTAIVRGRGKHVRAPHGPLTHFPHRFNCSYKPSRRIPRRPWEVRAQIRISYESVILSRTGFPRTWWGRRSTAQSGDPLLGDHAATPPSRVPLPFLRPMPAGAGGERQPLRCAFGLSGVDPGQNPPSGRDGGRQPVGGRKDQSLTSSPRSGPPPARRAGLATSATREPTRGSDRHRPVPGTAGPHPHLLSAELDQNAPV